MTLTSLNMVLFHIILLSLTLSLVVSHSFLTQPDAYYRTFQLRDCRGKECKYACPPFPKSSSEMQNTKARPARTWSRGQTVTIRWARNNHRSGFVQFSIVPVNVMMNRPWHNRLALYTGCFTQGAYRCKGEQQCGADINKTGFHRRLKVPTIYPDGDYVFAMVWFGGARFPVGAPEFSDYYSCSYIRIRGGPFGGSAQHFYEPGDVVPMRGEIKGRCLAVIDAPGVCSKHGCKGATNWKIPRLFKPAGNKPNRIRVSDVVKARKA